MKKSELYDIAICCVATRWINGEECMEDETAIAVLSELFERRGAELWNEMFEEHEREQIEREAAEMTLTDAQ